MTDWRRALNEEFECAGNARARGNEGQARVCARRAAGIAIREYLTRRGIRPPSRSAYDLLNLLKTDPHLPSELMQIVDHLTLRVTEGFSLPVEADLVAESQLLSKWLLPDWEESP
jgi:HEPN domain-containing protein